MIDFRKIEKKWQRKWEKAKIFEANPNPEKKKFFLTVPYPYCSGSLHIGHGRTYTIGDIIARFMRMKGFNVLWPMAFHITGTPIFGISKKIEMGDKEAISLYREYISIYEKNPEKIEKILESFKNPKKVASYFAKVIIRDFKALGFSIDWRRKFTTGDSEYKKFITWQFNKLKEFGYIVKKSYPILFCLRCNNAVGEDDIASGDTIKPEVGEYKLVKFDFENFYLVAATMRPETIFGITNLWVNKDGDYVKAEVDNEIWIISEAAAEKLEKQNRKVKILEKFKGEKLVGKYVKVPILNKEVIILPGSFVDVNEATGIVYSVPAHAPWDWVGLKDVKEIKPISIIKLKGFGEYPAIELCEKLGIKSLDDKEKIEKATEILYKEEFYNGVLKDVCGEFAGLSVKEAKEKVFNKLMEINKADKMYEVIALEKPVFCRCGGKVIVAILPDQWFIDYSNEEWKKLARECLSSMKIIPETYRKLFEDTIEWLHERPCARKRGIGTPLPWDKKYIIESLSDSTIYMCFYTVIHKIRENKIKANQLTNEFWDFVLLGKGDLEKVPIEKNLLEEIRKEFLYWYPNDIRHTAVGHITNHLTFFIFHHAAIFPKEHWPLAISLNEYVIREGAKMSKSKGNVIPLVDIPKKYSSDLYRLYISSTADLNTVVNWKENEVITVKGKLERFFELMSNAKKTEREIDFDKLDNCSKWFVSEINKKIKEATELLTNFEIKKYIQKAFFELLNETNYYIRRMEKINENVISYLADKWIRLLAPVIPHICEELWEKLGNKNFVSLENWPEYDEKKIDEKIMKIEETFRKTLDDIRHVLKITGKKNFAYLYVVSKEELNYFSESKKFLENEFGFEKVSIFSVSDVNKYDPQNKSIKAKEGRPAIYLE